MNVSAIVARWLGFQDVAEIGGLRPSFGAPWAHENPALVVLACAAVCWLIWMAVLLESAANPLSVVTAFTILVLASLLGVRFVRVNKVEYFEPLRPPLP